MIAYITEKQNLTSVRKAEEREVSSMAEARKIAEEGQVFQGTYLTVHNHMHEMVSWKPPGKPWQFPDYEDPNDWNGPDEYLSLT